MRMIPEWRKAWRMFSVQIMAGLAVLPLVWAELPPETKDMVPDEWRPWIVTALAACAVIGRLIKQPELEEQP